MQVILALMVLAEQVVPLVQRATMALSVMQEIPVLMVLVEQVVLVV